MHSFKISSLYHSSRHAVPHSPRGLLNSLSFFSFDQTSPVPTTRIQLLNPSSGWYNHPLVASLNPSPIHPRLLTFNPLGTTFPHQSNPTLRVNPRIPRKSKVPSHLRSPSWPRTLDLSDQTKSQLSEHPEGRDTRPWTSLSSAYNWRSRTVSNPTVRGTSMGRQASSESLSSASPARSMSLPIHYSHSSGQMSGF